MKHLIALIVLFAGISQAQAETLNCHGNEPFWGATISSDKLILEMADGKGPRETVVTGVDGAAGYSENFVQVFKNLNGPVATVITSTCDDSMGDFDYPQQIVIYNGDLVLYGCCGEGKPIEE